MSELFNRHKPLLEKAIDACDKRYSWTAFPESPSSKIHGTEIPAAAKTQFAELLGKPFPITMPGMISSVGEEVSPFTEKALGITYPTVDIEVLFESAKKARVNWGRTSIEELSLIHI